MQIVLIFSEGDACSISQGGQCSVLACKRLLSAGSFLTLQRAGFCLALLAALVVGETPSCPLPLDFCRVLAPRTLISAFMTSLSISSLAFTQGFLHKLCHPSHSICVLSARGRGCGLAQQDCLLSSRSGFSSPASCLQFCQS